MYKGHAIVCFCLFEIIKTVVTIDSCMHALYNHYLEIICRYVASTYKENSCVSSYSYRQTYTNDSDRATVQIISIELYILNCYIYVQCMYSQYNNNVHDHDLVQDLICFRPVPWHQWS